MGADEAQHRFGALKVKGELPVVVRQQVDLPQLRIVPVQRVEPELFRTWVFHEELQGRANERLDVWRQLAIAGFEALAAIDAAMQEDKP